MARNKKRKWSNLKDVIPEAPADKSPRQLEVDAAVSERLEKTPEELASEWLALEALDAEAAIAASARSIIYDALERAMLFRLEEIKKLAGTDMWRGTNGTTISPQYRVQPVITDPDALAKWVADGRQHLLELPKTTLKRIAGECFDTTLAELLSPAHRALLQPGDPGSLAPPPGVTAFRHTTVNFRGPSSKRRNEEGELETE